MAEKLSGEARKSALARLKGWREVAGRDAITRKFVFKDFNEAFGVYGARRFGCGKARPSSGMVQCLQSRGCRFNLCRDRCNFGHEDLWRVNIKSTEKAADKRLPRGALGAPRPGKRMGEAYTGRAPP